MARTKKRRSGRAARLKNSVYKAAMIGLLYDPEGTDAETQQMFDATVDKAYAGGLSKAQLTKVIGKAVEDAKAVSELLDAVPDAVIKLTDQGWKIAGGGNA